MTSRIDQSGARAKKIRRAQAIERRAIEEAQRAMDSKLTMWERVKRWWRK